MRTHFVMVEVTTTAEGIDSSPSGLEVEGKYYNVRQ